MLDFKNWLWPVLFVVKHPKKLSAAGSFGIREN